MAAPVEKPVVVTTTPEGITTIAIDRPHRRNAINPLTAQHLYRAFLAFEDDASQKVCIFHGRNGVFCAGYDLKELSQTGAPKAQGEPYQSVSAADKVDGRNMGPCGPTRMIIKKPVIVAVAGPAVAGGLELSLLGDIRVVEEDAIFGLFSRRFGVPLIDSGTIRLQSVVGLGRAMDIILTGRPIPAQEAYQMGLANRVVPKGKSYEEAYKLAQSILKFPQACLNVDRRSTYYSAWEAKNFADALDYEYNHGITVVQSESIQGATRFSSGEGRHGSFKASKL